MLFKKSPVTRLFLGSLLISGLMFSACGGEDEKLTEGGGTESDFEATTDTISSEVRNNFDMLRINIPMPGSLIAKLNASEIKYNKGILLSSGKAGSFSSNSQKAVGLGAFGADLNLAAAYNQSSDALEYLTQIAKLAEGLGIGSAFDPEFNKELLASVGKQDTFQVMLDKAFDKAERNLRSNERVAMSIMMITGGWIETLYTTVEALNSNPNGPGAQALYQDISVHCYGFEYVFQLYDAYKSNSDISKLAADMEPFKPALISIAKSNSWGAKELPQFRETVTQMRNKIIG